MAIRAAILDDEIKGSSLLEHKIHALEEAIEVVKVYNIPQQTLADIQSLELDVLFLDVEMPGINGFEFLEQLGSFSFEVIFVTAYNAYAIEALRANALDYLLKPVQPSELEQAVQKLKNKIALKRNSLNSPRSTLCNSRLSLPTAEGIYFVKKCDILKIEATSNYSVFHLANSSNKIIVSKTLKEYESLLDDEDFVRVNRSVIINLNYIVRYKRGDGGTLEMEDGSQVNVSSAKRYQLMAKLFDA